MAEAAWGSTALPGWRSRVFGVPATLGELAAHLATWRPAAMMAGAAWTDVEIERAVVALIEAELGIDMAKHTLDSRFIDDIGVD